MDVQFQIHLNIVAIGKIVANEMANLSPGGPGSTFVRGIYLRSKVYIFILFNSVTHKANAGILLNDCTATDQLSTAATCSHSSIKHQ